MAITTQDLTNRRNIPREISPLMTNVCNSLLHDRYELDDDRGLVQDHFRYSRSLRWLECRPTKKSFKLVMLNHTCPKSNYTLVGDGVRSCSFSFRYRSGLPPG